MSSSKSILKSTGLIGGGQAVALIFNLIRSKAVAVILGPDGTGLIGILQTSINVFQRFAELGVNNSSVRDIAKAHALDNQKEISSVIFTQRRLVLATGLLGFLLLFSFAKQVSLLTFDNPDYTWHFRVLAFAVFFNIIKSGQSSVIQATRKIKELALLSIYGSVLSAIIAIPIVYFFKMKGVPMFLLLVALSQFLISWYFSGRIIIKKYAVSLADFWSRSKGMLQLGMAFMGGGIFGMVGAYVIRIVIVKNVDLEGAGMYQAAFALGGMYINVILQAMGKDFYPRLTAFSNQSSEEIRLINEQTEIGMLISAPGLLITLAFGPWLIDLLYSSEFHAAYPILKWMILGVFLKTLSWPLDYLFIARARNTLFLLSQFLGNVVHIGLAYMFLQLYGLMGAGLAFFGLYLFHLVYLFLMAKRENGFTWSRGVIRNIVILSILFSLSLIILQSDFDWYIKSGLILIISLFSIHLAVVKIKKILGANSIRELLKFVFKKGH